MKQHVRRHDFARAAFECPAEQAAGFAFALHEVEPQLVVAGRKLDFPFALPHGVRAAVVDDQLAVDEQLRAVVALGPECVRGVARAADHATPAGAEILGEPRAREALGDFRKIDLPVDARHQRPLVERQRPQRGDGLGHDLLIGVLQGLFQRRGPGGRQRARRGAGHHFQQQNPRLAGRGRVGQRRADQFLDRSVFRKREQLPLELVAASVVHVATRQPAAKEIEHRFAPLTVVRDHPQCRLLHQRVAGDQKRRDQLGRQVAAIHLVKRHRAPRGASPSWRLPNPCACPAGRRCESGRRSSRVQRIGRRRH